MFPVQMECSDAGKKYLWRFALIGPDNTVSAIAFNLVENEYGTFDHDLSLARMKALGLY